MKTVLLDTNIFDKLAAEAENQELLKRLCARGHVRLIISRTVRDELALSPHQAFLTAMPIEVVGNATPVAGVMCAGDYLGNPDHYFKHKGESNKENDALVASAAEFHADWLISEDRRLLSRHKELTQSGEAFTYAEFLVAAKALQW